MSFTPGPWKVEPAVPGEASGVHVFAANPNGCAADSDFVTIADFIENEANARLIAAAPELYKACRDYTYWWERVPDRECVASVIENMRAAIAKAEGR